MREAIEKAQVLIEALKYIQAFRGRIVVIKVGGAALAGPEAWQSVLEDVVFMEQVRMMPVLVHGGGPYISAAMRRAGLEPRFVAGLRYTDEATLDIVKSTLVAEVNTPLVEGLKALGGRAQGIYPESGTSAPTARGVLSARRYTGRDENGREVDLGLVGEIETVDCETVLDVCRGESVPVIAPLALDGEGRGLNVNADSVAARIAVDLGAFKLVYVSDTHGVAQDVGDPTTVFSTLDATSIRRLIAEGVISGGMIPKVSSALKVLEGGVEKVHIIDGRIKHSLLLEIFTDAGVGTQIVRETEQTADAYTK